MAVDPGHRTLVILGERRSGVTYSFWLMSHVASQSRLVQMLRTAIPGGVAVTRVDFRDYVSDAVEQRCMRIAGDITIGLGLRKPTEPIAQEARNVSTIRHWIAEALRGTDKQRWIFFDSIDDVVTVSQGGVDELVHAIIGLTMDAQIPIRVVLAGREADKISTEHTMWAPKDTAAGLMRADVREWIRQRVRDKQGNLDDAALDAAGDPVPGQSATPTG